MMGELDWGYITPAIIIFVVVMVCSATAFVEPDGGKGSSDS